MENIEKQKNDSIEIFEELTLLLSKKTKKEQIKYLSCNIFTDIKKFNNYCKDVENNVYYSVKYDPYTNIFNNAYYLTQENFLEILSKLNFQPINYHNLLLSIFLNTKSFLNFDENNIKNLIDKTNFILDKDGNDISLVFLKLYSVNKKIISNKILNHLIINSKLQNNKYGNNFLVFLVENPNLIPLLEDKSIKYLVKNSDLSAIEQYSKIEKYNNPFVVSFFEKLKLNFTLDEINTNNNTNIISKKINKI